VFKSIVVGVDSSEHSLQAQTFAFYLARKLHASVLGLHVVDILSFEGPLLNDIAAPADVESYLDNPRIREALTSRGHKLLEDFAATAVREEVAAQTGLDFGLIANQICERSKSADLVVMGHRRLGPADIPANPGGIVAGVVRKASGTVLICPVAARELRHLVLAYDGSERSCKAMHAAAELASTLGASLTVVSVSRDPKIGEMRLAQAQTYFEPYRLSVEFFHLSGSAPQEILAFISCTSPDALFLGAYGHSRIVEMMLGSTTEQLLRNAPCPLFLSR
jgi:nucleotide-binding universal stress UspA family protein